ncbi:hypothetical protein HII31_11049 [Pseudocercospora fuligena]|uniref:Uncharacterized protein n=1 Tax=Pseudocercospora fuligena TaxID=685502 RepID=A0A8H6R9C5_9PEZI|nr:hypothetical protein HII31_11049 [Pseudocercospora fuligena]
MPGNPFYSLTRKLGRNWDGETRHLIHPRNSSCSITYAHAPNQPSPNPVLPGPWSASVADFMELSPEQADYHYHDHRFHDPTEEAASRHHGREKTTAAEDRSRAERSRSASYTYSTSATSSKARSRSADSKVQHWLQNVEDDEASRSSQHQGRG